MKLLFCLLALFACSHRAELKPVNGVYHQLVPRSSSSSQAVEIFWKKPHGKKPWPVVLYLHGNQEVSDNGGRTFEEWGVLDSAADLGFLAVSVSLPGFGESSGPRDFCGPDSQQAVHDVIRFLRRRDDVLEEKFALVGVGLGATVAAKVGEQVAGVAGIVLISGVYELGEAYRHWKADIETPEALALAAEFEHESVMSDAGPLAFSLRERSVLPEPMIQVPTLVLQGARDPLTLPLQAEELVRKLQKKGVDARAVIYPEAGHRIPTEARQREIEPFLMRVLKK